MSKFSFVTKFSLSKCCYNWLHTKIQNPIYKTLNILSKSLMLMVDQSFDNFTQNQSFNNRGLALACLLSLRNISVSIFLIANLCWHFLNNNWLSHSPCLTFNMDESHSLAIVDWFSSCIAWSSSVAGCWSWIFTKAVKKGFVPWCLLLFCPQSESVMVLFMHVYWGTVGVWIVCKLSSTNLYSECSLS